MMKQRRKLVLGLLIFLGVSMFVIAINSRVLGYGWDRRRTISAYVGLEAWSSALFCLGNIAVTTLVCKWLWLLGEKWKMPRWFFWLAFLFGAALMWVSVFPSGLYDVDGQKGAITLMHVAGARVLFAAMLLMAILILMHRRASAVTRGAALVYVVYGLICLMGYMSGVWWFEESKLVFESAYIAGFVMMLMLVEGKRREL